MVNNSRMNKSMHCYDGSPLKVNCVDYSKKCVSCVNQHGINIFSLTAYFNYGIMEADSNDANSTYLPQIKLYMFMLIINTDNSKISSNLFTLEHIRLSRIASDSNEILKVYIYGIYSSLD